MNVEESLFQFITSGSYPAAVVFHQVELYSLNAAIVTACVDLRVEQSTTEKQVSSVYSSLSCMNRCQASLYLKSKKKKNTAGPALIALTTLLCTAMHITMSL